MTIQLDMWRNLGGRDLHVPKPGELSLEIWTLAPAAKSVTERYSYSRYPGFASCQLGTIGVMPSVRVSEHSELAPEIVMAAARDFSDRRAQMWPDVHVEYLQVHETGQTYAEVTEGNPWPIGYVWERMRYDWSDSHALLGTVIDSNLFQPGSTWELRAYPEDGGSRVELHAVRHLRGRGWLLAPFFLPLPWISASVTVRTHLRHFLANINAPGGEVG